MEVNFTYLDKPGTFDTLTRMIRHDKMTLPIINAGPGLRLAALKATTAAQRAKHPEQFDAMALGANHVD